MSHIANAAKKLLEAEAFCTESFLKCWLEHMNIPIQDVVMCIQTTTRGNGEESKGPYHKTVEQQIWFERRK